MRRAVILFPSGLTLGNLFFGVFAIIAASRGDFSRAGVYVLLGGIFDALDGRVARATNAGSQFGEELDSLVDAISFGLAPAMIMYFAVLNRVGWDWIFVFLFAACAVMRLARFNIEQAGTAKMYFQGLPSPAAGITLASYYWFSQSWLYNYGAIGNLPWQELLRFLMALLAFLMISNIPYPVFPRTGFRSLRALGASLLVVGSIVLLLTKKLEFFFPFSLVYVAWGPIRWVFSGLFERRQPTIPYDLSEGEEDEDEEDEEFEEGSSQVHASRQGHREPPPAREERGKKTRTRELTPEPARTETAVRPDRPDRPDRPERPQRTEAERAARREKREKRDKREGRPERTPRPPRPDRPADSAPRASGVDAITLGTPTPAPEADDEVIGSIPGAAAPVAAVASTEGAPGRKRRRHRRRGERKERGSTDSSGAVSEGSDGGESSDDTFEEPSGEVESRSPYSAPAESAPPTVAAPVPPPIPPAEPVSLPRAPITLPISSEPDE
jgi:CDP-diacylglycerol--serine O-phosphatidyltransferase